MLVIVLGWYPRPLPRTPLACTPAYVFLSQDADRRAGVLDLPRGVIKGRINGMDDLHDYISDEAYMMYQACHLHPIVNGSHFSYRERNADRSTGDRYNLEQQRRQLVENNVKYIVIHPPNGGLFDWSPGDEPDHPIYENIPCSALRWRCHCSQGILGELASCAQTDSDSVDS